MDFRWEITDLFKTSGQKDLYYQILRFVARDFNFNLNRTSLLKHTRMEDINLILTKRNSLFLIKLIVNLEPTNLACILMSKSYENERVRGKLVFFDTSINRFGRRCFSNSAKDISEKWRFDWLNLTVENFKTRLHAQFQRNI